MHFSLKNWHLVSSIFNFPWLFPDFYQKKYFPLTFPWPLKFPEFFQFSLTCRNPTEVLHSSLQFLTIQPQGGIPPSSRPCIYNKLFTKSTSSVKQKSLLGFRKAAAFAETPTTSEWRLYFYQSIQLTDLADLVTIRWSGLSVWWCYPRSAAPALSVSLSPTQQQSRHDNGQCTMLPVRQPHITLTHAVHCRMCLRTISYRQ